MLGTIDKDHRNHPIEPVYEFRLGVCRPFVHPDTLPTSPLRPSAISPELRSGESQHCCVRVHGVTLVETAVGIAGETE
jgi:hypothetical protein